MPNRTIEESTRNNQNYSSAGDLQSFSSARTADEAIAKVRRLSLLPKGTHVLCRQHFRGVVDGMTLEGDYVVKFDQPVQFASLGMKVYRGSFPVSDVKELND